MSLLKTDEAAPFIDELRQLRNEAVLKENERGDWETRLAKADQNCRLATQQKQKETFAKERNKLIAEYNEAINAVVLKLKATKKFQELRAKIDELCKPGTKTSVYLPREFEGLSEQDLADIREMIEEKRKKGD